MTGSRTYKAAEIMTGTGERMTVIFDNSKSCNPFSVYLVYYDHHATKHRRKLAAYADMVSCIDHIRDMIIRGVIHGSIASTLGLR